MIVLADADIASVVEGVRAFGYYNAGQDCTAACRIYADEKIYERLVADLSSAVSTIKTGSQQEPGVEMGPLISARQRDRVASFVDRASQLAHTEITAGGSTLVDSQLDSFISTNPLSAELIDKPRWAILSEPPGDCHGPNHLPGR